MGLVFGNLHVLNKMVLRGCSLSFCSDLVLHHSLLTSCSALVCMFGVNDLWSSSSAVFSLLPGFFPPEIDVNAAGLRQQNCYLGQKLWNLRGELVQAAFFFFSILPHVASVCLFSFFFSSALFLSAAVFISSPLVFLSPGEVCIRAGLQARTVPILHFNKKDGWKHCGSCSGTFLLTALCYHHRRQFFLWGSFRSLI